MPYASAFERDIFISYCHTDNENPLGLGWIEVFHKILLIRMKQILGARLPEEEPSIWRDTRLQGNEAFASTIGDELRKVALVVSVMSPSYVRSEWCAREINEFCQAAEQRGGLAVGNKTRIFKVLKTPVDRDQHPPALQSQIGYEFFTLDHDTKIPREFTLTPGDSHGARALEIINDLAYHIKGTLDALNQSLGAPRHAAESAQAPVPRAARQSVYLAETSFQLDDERSQVRRELEARGVRVLPEGDLPVRHPLHFRQAVSEALSQCDLSVHMVAPYRSLILTGELRDTVYLQNQLAAEQCTRSNLTRLIWIPEGRTPREEDPLQREFITMLHRDPEAQKNAEVLTNQVQALIARIHDTLRKLDEQKTRPAASPDVAAARSRICLIAHPDDAPMTEPLRESLFDSGCEVLEALSDPNATEKEIFETHKMNLIDCDAVVVCFGTAGEFWMRSQLSDARKAVGWRDGRPMRARAIYLGPPDTASKVRLRMHDYFVLDGRAGFDATRLTPLLDALGSPPRGGG